MNFFFPDNSDAKAHERDRLHLLSNKLDTLLRHFGEEQKQEDIPSLSSNVRAHLKRGDKIGAIKVYRDETGVDLREAKQAVEEKAEAVDGDSLDEIEEKINRLMRIQGISLPDVPKTDITQKVVFLLQRNNKIEAIKIYREAKNVGLKEAKDAVDSIEASLRNR